MIQRPSQGYKNFPRVLNRSGRFNTTREGLRGFDLRDLYHSLLRIRWRYFLGTVGLSYVLINLIFGEIYFLMGSDALEGLRHETLTRQFMDCLFFSVQTLATIGYGRITPSSLSANFLVMIEAFVGMLSLALVTGLLFARFSKPTARIRFSEVALITSQNSKPCLMFRMANARLNQIVEAHLNVVLVRTERTLEGEVFRRLYDLKLVRNHSPMFAMTWTVTHIIDEQSPLFGQTYESLKNLRIEILCSLTGLDETFAQTIHSRFSYSLEDLRWNAHFVDILEPREDGRVHIQIDRLSDFTLKPQNL